MRYAQLFDGTKLSFPDDTPDEVINRVAREETLKRNAPPVQAPIAPSTERTTGQAIGDLGASFITGTGRLLAVPGQIIALGPGLRGIGSAVSAPGEAIAEFGEGLKSQGLKVREALRSQAISEAEKDGILSEFATAIKETIKDPGLLSSFLTEQIPNLIPTAFVGRLFAKLGISAAQGLTGEAAEQAIAQAQRRGVTAAVGTGAAMQSADISSEAYKQAYAAAIAQGKPPEQAESEANNAARLAAGGAFGVSMVTQRLPGARAIEQRLVGAPGSVNRLVGGLGEATAETLEEAGGALFKNLGIRTVDPNQSLTQGVGAAAGLGLIGGGFFGTLLSKKATPAPLPGQLPGETIEQSILRLVTERESLKTPPVPESIIPDVDVIKLAGSLDEKGNPIGYALLTQYEERLKQLPESPERDQALQVASSVKERLSIESIQRQQNAYQNIITYKDMKDLGLNESDPLYESLVGKNLGAPDDATKVIEALNKELEQDIPSQRRELVGVMLEQVQGFLDQVPGSGFYAPRTDQRADGAGASVSDQLGAGTPGGPQAPSDASLDASTGLPGKRDEGEAEQPRPLRFETELGSTYEVNDAGETIRTKRSPGKGQGTTYPPHSVLYVSPENIIKILDDRLGGNAVRLGYRKDYETGAMFAPVSDRSQIPEGAQPLVAVVNKKNNELVGVYPAQVNPEVGLHPVEKRYEGGQSFTHLGNKIVRLLTDKDIVTPKMLEDLGIKKQSAVAKRILGKEVKSAEVKAELAKRKQSLRTEEAQEQPQEAPQEVPQEVSPPETPKERIDAINKQLEGLMKRLLSKYGLKDVSVQIVKDMAAKGEFSGRLIKLADDTDNPLVDLRHEAIHALKELGFFTPAQWETLKNKAAQEWVQTYLKDAPYTDKVSRYEAYKQMFEAEGKNPQEVEEALIEEAIADAFSYFNKTRAPSGLMASINFRLKNLFKALKQFLTDSDLSAEDIFGRIEEGKLQPAVPSEMPNQWKADATEKEKAEKYEAENGIKPYVSEGQIQVPLEAAGAKLSIKKPYAGRELEGYIKKKRDGTIEKVPPKFNDPMTGLPLNADGTVTVYLPTTNEAAREIARTKKLKGSNPTANRIYLTNESSGPAVMNNPGNIDSPIDGANVMLRLDPRLLNLDQEFENGRKDFFIPIAEGQAFAQKAAMTKMFTMNLPRDKAISKDTTLADLERRIEKSINDYLMLSTSQQKERLDAAKDILKKEHNVGSLLTVNGKLEKTNTGGYGLNNYNGKDVVSMGLGLASAQKINEKNLSTCPNSSMCEGLCLGETSGQNQLYGGDGQFRSGPRLAQYLKTEALILHPEEFAILLHSEIDRFHKAAVAEDYQPSIRMNVTSDFRPQTFKALFAAFPGVEFYDYTKLPSNTIAPNHHLTYSSTGASQVVNGEVIINPGSNWSKMIGRLRDGNNVAMAFTSKTTMPDFVLDEKSGERFQVWNGDNYDARFLDPKPGQPENLLNKGMIIGLTNKDRTTPPSQAAKQYNGFFMDYERSRDGPVLIIRDQSKLKAEQPVAQPVQLVRSKVKLSLRSDPPAAKEAMALVRKARAYKPEEGEPAVAFPLLFHSGTGDPQDIATYIEPRFGSWVSEVLSGSAEENVDVDNFVPLSYYSSAPTWVRMQTARKLNKTLAEVTDQDVKNSGQLAVVYNVDDQFGDPVNNVYQIGKDGYNGGYTDVLDVYGNQKKLYETDLEEEGDYRSEAKTLFGVEPGDIVSKELITPDMVLVGDALIDFLNQYESEFPAQDRKGSKFSLRGPKVATWFSGARTLEAALGDINTVMAVEYDKRINEFANSAFGTAFVARDVADVDVQEIKDADPVLFHASPVCKNFSAAKTFQGADDADRKSAEAVSKVIREVSPPIVTVENVPKYASTALFQNIVKALDEKEYTWDVVIHDAADYGAAQTRNRMLLRAVKDGDLPPLPEKVGPSDWYKQIEDLLPDAPASTLPPVERRRLNEMIDRGQLDPKKPIITMGGSGFKGTWAAANDGGPSPTLKAANEKARVLLPDGEVKVVTPRMMARLMGLPDTYAVPSSPTLAKTVLGNGIHGDVTRSLIAPLLAQGSKFSLRSPDTKAFKQWFGDSKIVDENGNPLVVYHGTDRDFAAFSRKARPRMAIRLPGFYFTPDSAVASTFAGKGTGANVMPVYLSIKDPVVIDMSRFRVDRSRSVLEMYDDFDERSIDYLQEKLIRAMAEGKDGAIIRGWNDGSGEVQYVAFKPEQIKSATGNIGTFDPTNPDIRYSLRTPKQNIRSQIPQNILTRVDATIAFREDKTFARRMMDAISPRGFSWFREQAINRYEYLAKIDRKYVNRMGGVRLLADQSAEAAALFSDLGAGITASAFGVHDRVGGIPVYRNGVVQVSNENNTIKGPLAVFAPLGKYGDPEVYRLYEFWATVKRGARLNAQGKLTPFTPADIAHAQALQARFPEFVTIQREWIKYNDGLVKFMQDTGVITPQAAQEFKQHGDYFPMYKYFEGDEVTGPKVFSSIANVAPPKKYKGDDQPLGDFFENVVRNTQAAIQAGIKNIAAQRATQIAVAVKEVTPLKFKPKKMTPEIYRVLENGMERYYAANDMMMISALKSLNIPDLPLIGVFAGPANLLRNLITKTPDFMMANMLRDSLSAWVTSGKNITPVISTMINFSKAIAEKSPELNALRNAGILGGYDYAQGVEATAQTFAKDLRKISNSRTTMEKITSPVTSLWGALEKASSASDAATRMEVYKKTLAETGNEAEALFQALEIMNFNRKGRSPVIRALTAAVPFLNARIQGLDVLYRSGIRPLFAGDATVQERARAKTFFLRGATIMALSAMYWMMTHDDDEYKVQEQETRDNYWLLPSIGVKIPIPFEIGVIFKVIPERILEYSFGDDTGKDFVNAMSRQLLNTFSFNPIPQTVVPIVEAATNYSFFTTRPILGQGMEGIAPEFQATPTTSKTATAITDAYNSVIELMPDAVAKKLKASPVILEHLIQGYTGTMGMYAMQTMDYIISANSDVPNASKRFEQMPVIRRFAVDPQARGTVTAFYDMKNAVDSVTRTANYLERTMNFEDQAEFIRDNIKTLAVKDYVQSLEKTMKEFREQKVVIRSSTMSADAKRSYIDIIEKMELQLTANIRTLKKQME